MVFIVSIILLSCLALYISTVVDIHRRNFATRKRKAFWLTLVVIFPVAGPIIYFLFKDRRNMTSFEYH